MTVKINVYAYLILTRRNGYNYLRINMQHLTILQIDTMIMSLKQSGHFNPRYTLEQAYEAWKQLQNTKNK